MFAFHQEEWKCEQHVNSEALNGIREPLAGMSNENETSPVSWLLQRDFSRDFFFLIPACPMAVYIWANKGTDFPVFSPPLSYQHTCLLSVTRVKRVIAAW